MVKIKSLEEGKQGRKEGEKGCRTSLQGKHRNGPAAKKRTVIGHYQHRIPGPDTSGTSRKSGTLSGQARYRIPRLSRCRSRRYAASSWGSGQGILRTQVWSGYQTCPGQGTYSSWCHLPGSGFLQIPTRPAICVLRMQCVAATCARVNSFLGQLPSIYSAYVICHISDTCRLPVHAHGLERIKNQIQRLNLLA